MIDIVKKDQVGRSVDCWSHSGWFRSISTVRFSWYSASETCLLCLISLRPSMMRDFFSTNICVEWLLFHVVIGFFIKILYAIGENRDQELEGRLVKLTDPS